MCLCGKLAGNVKVVDVSEKCVDSGLTYNPSYGVLTQFYMFMYICMRKILITRIPHLVITANGCVDGFIFNDLSEGL